MKINDRVRINNPNCSYHKLEGTIIEVYEWGTSGWRWLSNSYNGYTAYVVEIDGIGSTFILSEKKIKIGFPRHHLIPIVPPSQELGSWDEITRLIGTDIRKTTDAYV